MSGGEEGPIGRAHARARIERRVLELAIVFALYYVAGKLGQATTEIRDSNLGPVWPAYGVALAAIIVCGARVWPALLVSSCLVAIQSPVPPATAIAQASASVLAALVGGWLLRLASFDRSLSRLKDAIALVVLGAALSPLVSSGLGIAALAASGVQPYSGILLAGRRHRRSARHAAPSVCA